MTPSLFTSADVLLALVARVQTAFAHALAPHELYERLLGHLLPATASGFGFVGTVRQQGATVLLVSGLASDGTREEALRDGDTLLGEALRALEPREVDSGPSPDASGFPCAPPAGTAWLVVPLFHGGLRCGVLLLAGRPGGYRAGPESEALWGAVAAAVGALRIERGRQRAEGALDRALADISVRREADAWLRDRDALLRKLTQQVPGVVHQLRRTPEGHLTMPYASEGLRQAYELMPDDVRDDARPFLARVHPNDAPALWAATLHSFETLEPWRATYRVLLPRAGLRWHEAHTAAERLPDGSVLWTGYIADITERKGYEEAMVAAEAAQRANLAKTEFLSRMSHELRTPLNAVLGFSQLLLLDRAALSEDQRDKLRHIHTAGAHLLAMINDVLDLSRIESGTIALSLDVVQVEAVAGEALAMVAALARETGVRLSLHPPREPGRAPAGAFVRADHVRLRQVLVNLLSNAVKYNRPGGSARIDWRITEDADRVVVGVEDTGLGLTGEQLAHLWEPFNRLGAERSKVEGTGIGLVLSRRLVELMQGDIGVTSEARRGSRFEVRLPLALPHPPPAMPDAAAAPGPHAARKLLYAEDNPLNVELVAQVLRLRPAWRLLIARSGAHALELAHAERPDLLLLDMHLGDMTGIDVARRLDRSPQLRGRPRVALSADAMPERRREAAQAGFADYLTKPLDVDALLGCLDRYLGDTPPPPAP